MRATMADVGSGLDEAMTRVGDRWTLLVVDALLSGPLRFSDLQQAIPGLAPNVLSSRLRRLEHDGLVVGTPYSRRPLRLEYRVTDAGRELAGVVTLLTRWGAGAGGEGPRHSSCGTAMEARWHCPTCAVDAEPGEDDLVWL